MKCKKLISLAMAGVMTLSMAIVPGMAANETKISGSYQEIVIDVVLLPTGKAQINPYGMPVKAYNTQSPATVLQDSGVDLTLNTAGKIATQPLAMYNKTTSQLSVGATVSAANVSGLELTTAAIPASSTDKLAQVYLEVKESTLTNSEVQQTAAATTVGTIKGKELVDALNAWDTTTYDRNSTSQVLVSPDEPTTKKNLATMKAATVSGGTTTVGTGGVLLYRLGGDCTTEPETPWATSDKFDINVAFSFQPMKVLAAASSGTIELSATSMAQGGTLTATYTAPAGVTLSRNAVYKWTVGNNCTVSAGQGTSSITIANSATSAASGLSASLVIVDGLTEYQPAAQTYSIT